jgi:hypothetical protein
MTAAGRIRKHSHIWERDDADWYVEPTWCSRRLFEVEQFEGNILDPACGMGRIVDAAQGAGLDAIGSDLAQRGTETIATHAFLALDYSFTAANIVSNPPFGLFEDFARKALTIATNKVALIWLVRRLNAARWIAETPLARIYLLTTRPSMPPGDLILRGEKPGGGKQDFCWLVWERDYMGNPVVGWLHRDFLE